MCPRLDRSALLLRVLPRPLNALRPTHWIGGCTGASATCCYRRILPTLGTLVLVFRALPPSKRISFCRGIYPGTTNGIHCSRGWYLGRKAGRLHTPKSDTKSRRELCKAQDQVYFAKPEEEYECCRLDWEASLQHRAPVCIDYRNQKSSCNCVPIR